MGRIESVKRILLASLAIIAVTIGIVQPVAAQNNQGLVVTPPTFELAGNPGSVISNSIRVDNLSDKSLELTVDRRNFEALGEEGQVELTEQDSSYSLASWISVDPGKVTIPSKASQTFSFTITIPANAEPGGRFGSIVFKTAIDPLKDQSGLAVGQELGTLILLRVAGSVTENAQITGFNPASSFIERGPVTFATHVKNEGNVHVKPAGTITVTNVFGRKIASVPVESKNILPGATRKLNATLPQKSLFGPYTATVSLQYGVGQKIITSSTKFTVIPYKLILIWIAVIGGLGFLIYKRRTRLLKAIRVLSGRE